MSRLDGGRARVATWADFDAEKWNSFVAGCPHGHYMQTTHWARVKAATGWEALRIVQAGGDEIVAGIQLLVRPGRFGSIAYGPGGPLSSSPNELKMLIDLLGKYARRHQVRLVGLHPPQGSVDRIGEILTQRGYAPTSLIGSSTATVQLDLTQSAESLLGNMRKGTRANVRRGLSRGITVREGEERDLDIFHRLLRQTAGRKGFSPPTREHLHQMWTHMRPHGHLLLLVAELGTEPVSGLLAIPFGDTVYTRLYAWTGEHGERKPNEALEWAAISWARTHQYRVYDLGGIDPYLVTHQALEGSIEPGSDKYASSYKLGFGGTVTTRPPAYEMLPNPLLRFGLRHVFPSLESIPVARRLRKRILRRLDSP